MFISVLPNLQNFTIFNSIYSEKVYFIAQNKNDDEQIAKKEDKKISNIHWE